MNPVKVKEKIAVFGTPANRRIIRLLSSSFESVLILSELRYAVAEPDRAALESLAGPGRFDWVVISDIRAADSFIRIASAADIDLFAYDETKVCSVGEASADRLRFEQMHTDVIPSSVRPEEVVLQLKAFDGEEGRLEGARVLVIETSGSPASPAEHLAEAGAEVTRVKTCAPEAGSGPDPKQKALILGGGADAFYFGSPSDVFDRTMIWTGMGVGGGDALRGYCGDRVTERTLAEYGYTGALLSLSAGGSD